MERVFDSFASPNGDGSIKRREKSLPTHRALDVPERIGHFLIKDRIGKGGMGDVFLAIDPRGGSRKLAVKVISPHMMTQDGIARFKSESEVLRLMNHENICRVYEAGETDDGFHFFAMEYIEGDPVTRACDFKQLTLLEKLKLFQSCCSGVQHAHNNGVIHRDIKPNNVLLAERDGRFIVKIIDFGVAKNRVENEATLRSRIGDIIGTLSYMSPEQAAGKHVATTSDIYSLGVLLYELVTGLLPHDMSKKSMAQAIGMISHDEPRRPSHALETTTQKGRSSVYHNKAQISRLLSALKGDLDWIILQALSKSPHRRYATPMDLAEDIERFLKGEPVVARSDSLYRLGKNVRRYFPYWLSGTAALVLAIVSFLAINQARLSAVEARKEAEN